MTDHSGERGTCGNCGRTLTWHPVGQAWIHADLGHYWCFPERQGYDQPRATPSLTASSEASS